MLAEIFVSLAVAAAAYLFFSAYRNLKKQRYRQIDQLDDDIGNDVAPWDEGEPAADDSCYRSISSLWVDEYRQHLLLTADEHVSTGCQNPCCKDPCSFMQCDHEEHQAD